MTAESDARTENLDELGEKSGLDMNGWVTAGLTGLFVIIGVAILIGITVWFL